MMKKSSMVLSLLCLWILLFGGCMQFALRLSPSLFPNFAAAIFEECDPELARSAIPANLKLLEGFLKSDPENKQILTSLSMGFSGYSMLFVEEDEPDRASELYLRARDYGMRALGDKGRTLKNLGTNGENLSDVLKAIGKEDLEALFWSTISWGGWINLNLDKPAALAQLSPSQACLKRIMEIDADYLHGLPYMLMGITLAARPPMFGGDIQQARSYLEKTLELSQRKFFLAQYYLAKYYTVRAQDKELFFNLIEEIIGGNPDELRDVCLINTMTQHKAKKLKNMADELFF